MPEEKPTDDAKRKRNLHICHQLIAPLRKIFNPDAQYLVVKSKELDDSDGLLRYEVTYRNDSISVKESYPTGIKDHKLIFESLAITTNGRPSSQEEQDMFRKRIDQSKADYNKKEVRLVIYPLR